MVFPRSKSLGAKHFSATKSTRRLDERREKDTGRIPFFEMKRMSLSDITGSVKSNGYESEAEDDNVFMENKHANRRQQICRRFSKTRRGLLRLTNWSYERAWRKERKSTFDPIVIHISNFHMGQVRCDCKICPCEHDRLNYGK